MDLVDVQVVYNATSRLDETVEENRASPICYGHPTPLASTNSVQRSSAVSSTVLTCTFGGTSFSSSRIPRFPRPHDEHARISRRCGISLSMPNLRHRQRPW